MKEWITNYDFRGEWASQESKNEIRSQVNRKIEAFVAEARLKALDEAIEIVSKAYLGNDERVFSYDIDIIEALEALKKG